MMIENENSLKNFQLKIFHILVKLIAKHKNNKPVIKNTKRLY